MELFLVLVVTVLCCHLSEAGLLGAGQGHGSCAAFPYREQLVDHVGGCPRWAECCTEYGYCHGRDQWEKGYFRDCNGESNGQPLPGSVIRLEAEQAASGDSEVTATVLGITQELWQREVKRASLIISSSSSSSSTSSSSSSLTSSSSSSLSSSTSTAQRPLPTGATISGTSQGSLSLDQSSSGSLSSSDLISQILLALQPQIALAVQTAVSDTNIQGGGSLNLDTSSISSNSGQNSFITGLITTSNNQNSAISSSGLGTGTTGFGISNTGLGTSNKGLSTSSIGFGTSNTGLSTSSTGFGTSSTSGESLGSSQIDVSRLVDLVLAQLTPQITSIVQSGPLA